MKQFEIIQCLFIQTTEQMEKRPQNFLQSLQKKFDVRILRILLTVDQQITNNLKDGDIATR